MTEMQNDNTRLKASISKLVKTVMYVSFIIMFGLAAIASPLFLVLFGEKWLPSVPIFQALCLAYAISPMQVINHNIFKVKGRTDLFLKTEIMKYVFFAPVLILGIYYGLTILVVGIILFYWIGFFINALYSKRLIGYSFYAQFRDFLPLLLLLGLPAIFSFGIGLMLNVNSFLLLAIQTFTYLVITLGLSAILKVSGLLEITEILKNKFTIYNVVKTFKN